MLCRIPAEPGYQPPGHRRVGLSVRWLHRLNISSRYAGQGAKILEQAREEGRKVIILAGHPYHVDPLINHKIPEALAGMGVDVITEDAVPLEPGESLADPLVLTQWEYLNRIFHAARWSGEQPDIEMAQLNSFGCGPDAFAIDEVRGILEECGKNQTVIRIDEINSLGSARLRLRSMLQAKKENQGSIRNRDTQEDNPPVSKR